MEPWTERSYHEDSFSAVLWPVASELSSFLPDTCSHFSSLCLVAVAQAVWQWQRHTWQRQAPRSSMVPLHHAHSCPSQGPALWEQTHLSPCGSPSKARDKMSTRLWHHGGRGSGCTVDLGTRSHILSTGVPVLSCCSLARGRDGAAAPSPGAACPGAWQHGAGGAPDSAQMDGQGPGRAKRLQVPPESRAHSDVFCLARDTQQKPVNTWGFLRIVK